MNCAAMVAARRRSAVRPGNGSAAACQARLLPRAQDQLRICPGGQVTGDGGELGAGDLSSVTAWSCVGARPTAWGVCTALVSTWPDRAICGGRGNLALTGEAIAPRWRVPLRHIAAGLPPAGQAAHGERDVDQPHPRDATPSKLHTEETRDAPRHQLPPGPGPHSRPAPARPAERPGPRHPAARGPARRSSGCRPARSPDPARPLSPSWQATDPLAEPAPPIRARGIVSSGTADAAHRDPMTCATRPEGKPRWPRRSPKPAGGHGDRPETAGWAGPPRPEDFAARSGD